MARGPHRRAALAAAGLVAAGAPFGALGAPGRVAPADGALHREPAPALNERGDALAAWVRAPLSAPAAGVVRVAERRGARGGWGPSRPLSRAGAARPRAALGATRDALVVWQEGSRLVAASRPGARGRWSARVVAEGAAAVHDLEVALGADGGRAQVLWSERAGDGWRVRHAVRAAASEAWAAPAPALALPGPAAPSLALAARRGGAVAAWAEGAGEGARVRLAALAGDRWSVAGIAADPAVATAAALSTRGDALAVWATGLPGGSRVVAARDRPAGRDLRDPADLGLGIAPRAAINARGDALAAWQVLHDDGRRGIGAAVRARFAGGWTPSTVVPADCACDLALGRVALSARGTAVVAWQRDGRRGPGRGAVGLLPPGAARWAVRVTGPADTLTPPAVAVSARGAVLALQAHAEGRAPIRVVVAARDGAPPRRS